MNKAGGKSIKREFKVSSVAGGAGFPVADLHAENKQEETASNYLHC